MADRFPLIANSSSNQIQEITSGDTLDLTGNNVDNAVNVKATGIVTFSNATDSTSSTTGAVIISGGVGIAKSLFVGNNVTIGGTVTYEDVTNVDSVGIITAQTGVIVTAGRGVQVTAGGVNVDAGIGTFDAGVNVGSNKAITLGTGATVTSPATNTLTVGTSATVLNFGAGFSTATPVSSGISTIEPSRVLTIGVRSGTAVTFSISGGSFNIPNRAGGNTSIDV